MVEVFSVNPRDIRGLGNIIESKTGDDFNEYKAYTTSGSDTIDGVSRTVYTSEYKVGSNLTITYPSLIGTSATSFTVSATLKDSSNNALQYQYIYLDVNGTVIRKPTGSDGVTTPNFTVDTDGSKEYTLKAYFLGSSSISGCVAFGKVHSGDPNSITVMSSKPILQTSDVAGLIATVTDANGEPVPYASVTIYEEYTPTTVMASASPNPIQTGDTTTLYGVLKDEDGSMIQGETVELYVDYGLTEVTDTIGLTKSGSTLSAYCENGHGDAVVGEIVCWYKNDEYQGYTYTNSSGIAQYTGTSGVWKAEATGEISSTVTIT